MSIESSEDLKPKGKYRPKVKNSDGTMQAPTEAGLALEDRFRTEGRLTSGYPNRRLLSDEGSTGRKVPRRSR